MNISLDTAELIKELKNDIAEFGPRCLVDVKFSPLQFRSEPFATDYNLHFNPVDPDLDDEDLDDLIDTELNVSEKIGEYLEVMQAVDALLIFARQDCAVGGLQYLRDLINEYKPFIKIKPLLDQHGINYGNYKRFMAGEHGKLSEEKAVTLFKALLNRPIV